MSTPDLVYYRRNLALGTTTTAPAGNRLAGRSSARCRYASLVALQFLFNTLTIPTDLPPSPMTPSGEGKRKKANPLNDLLDTEKVYVEQLTGIIRVRARAYVILVYFSDDQSFQKVASAWSRSNLPPPELDKMFRGIEAVYKANRTLNQVTRHDFTQV
jgi:hypothetical protein